MKKILPLLLVLCSAFALVSCDDCRKIECNNGGTCSEGICACPEGFSGTYCDAEDLCITQEVECLNDGECLGGECDCKTFYYGESCADYCVYGTYADGNCNCNEGIEGENCDIFSREKFLGTYTFTSSFTTQVQTSVISNGEFQNGDITKVEMTNLSSVSDTDGYAKIEGTQISFPNQQVKGQGNVKYQMTTVTPGTWEDNATNITFTIVVTRLANIQGATVQTGTYVYKRPSF